MHVRLFPITDYEIFPIAQYIRKLWNILWYLYDDPPFQVCLFLFGFKEMLFQKFWIRIRGYI